MMRTPNDSRRSDVKHTTTFPRSPESRPSLIHGSRPHSRTAAHATWAGLAVAAVLFGSGTTHAQDLFRDPQFEVEVTRDIVYGTGGVVPVLSPDDCELFGELGLFPPDVLRSRPSKTR